MGKSKIIFMGSPSFATSALKVLLDAKDRVDVASVYTQAPKPKDRGHIVQKTPVHLLAEQHGIPVFTPAHFKDENECQTFLSHDADLAIVAAYGFILPKRILLGPRLGCVNLHASLLPRFRGAAPVQRAILANDQQTGITLMRMDEGMDTGDILAKQVVPIDAKETTPTLLEKLTQASGRLLSKHLDDLLMDTLSPIKQPDQGIVYAPKISKEESFLNFEADDAFTQDLKVRAFAPWPGTRCVIQGVEIKIHETDVIDEDETRWIFENHPHLTIGQFFSYSNRPLCIVCAKSTILELKLLQRPGAKILNSADFLTGFSMNHVSI